MILTISTTHQPNGDLGYLLHKHPDKLQTFNLSFGKAHIFYPENSQEKTSCSLLLDINPISIIRNKKGQSLSMQDYVNDRPYVCSSFMSTAISQLLGSALNGRCNDRPEIVKKAIPLTLHLATVSAKGGIDAINKCFEPLGYEIEAKSFLIDENFPEWGESNYFELTLKNTITLKDALSHLYVLLPVLDKSKHYYITKEEIEKLLEKGENWLKNHPNSEYIIYSYFKKKRSLGKDAMSQLMAEEEDQKEVKNEIEINPIIEEKRVSLHELRLNRVLEEVKKSNAKTVIDLGCGEGRLIQKLLTESIEKIVGLDISYQSLEIAKKRLKMNLMGQSQLDRIELIHGALTYCDERMKGFDCATLVEVIEHVDENRLDTLAKVVFDYAKPTSVILSTPNVEYNILYDNLHEDKFRHNDHRFEWSRKTFENWANSVAKIYDYTVIFDGIGDEQENVGTPSQLAVFTKK